MLQPAKSMIICFAHARSQPVYASRTLLFNFACAISRCSSFSFYLVLYCECTAHTWCIQIAILCNSEWHPCTTAGRPTVPAWGTVKGNLTLILQSLPCCWLDTGRKPGFLIGPMSSLDFTNDWDHWEKESSKASLFCCLKRLVRQRQCGAGSSCSAEPA